MNKNKFKEITNEEDLNEFLNNVGYFNDGIIKEAHIVNNSYIDDKLSMICDFRYNLKLLIQRQYKNPSTVEIIFIDVKKFSLSCDDNYDSIIFETKADFLISEHNEKKTITLDFGDTKVSSRRILYRDASEWLGPGKRY